MNAGYTISQHILSDMYHLLYIEKYAAQTAPPTDLKFITDGKWLKDAAVIDVISNRNGAWHVSLVFAYYKDPLQLMVRRITTCFSEQKANATAFYVRKDTAKDGRGTLNISIKDLGLCYN